MPTFEALCWRTCIDVSVIFTTAFWQRVLTCTHFSCTCTCSPLTQPRARAHVPVHVRVDNVHVHREHVHREHVRVDNVSTCTRFAPR